MSPDIQFRESRRLIPPSQGLLATTDTRQSVPASPPTNDILQNDPAAQVFMPHCSAPHYPPAQRRHTANPASIESLQLKIKNCDQSPSKKTEDEKRFGFLGPKRKPSFNSPHDPTQPKIQSSERPRRQEFTLLPSALPADTPPPMQGLRLLNYQPVPQSDVTFPNLPMPASPRPAMVIAAPRGEEPMIKLLHIDAGPKMESNTPLLENIFFNINHL